MNDFFHDMLEYVYEKVDALHDNPIIGVLFGGFSCLFGVVIAILVMLYVVIQPLIVPKVIKFTTNTNPLSVHLALPNEQKTDVFKKYTEINFNTLYTMNDLDCLIIGDTRNVEFVHYRLNGVEIGKKEEPPYNIFLPEESVPFDTNELKIAIKWENDDRILEQYLYFTKGGPDYVEQVIDIDQIRTVPAMTEDTTTVRPIHVPVLMYHDFKDEVPEDEQSVTVSTELFEAHIKTLLAWGYHPITFTDLYNYLNGNGRLPYNPVIITADDGYLSNYTIAYPILKQYNVPATYFVSTAYVGVDTYMEHFTWEQAKEMEDSGLITIQSHTHTHALLNELSYPHLFYQVNYSFELIEQHLGERDIRVLSYPMFRYDNYTIGALESIGVDLQITNINGGGAVTTPTDVKRIHVSNFMSPMELIWEIQRLEH
ncbi:MAG: hypothetical protein ATN35_10005 [Epulopiscium sp. Nele67-Bin004]|nr:MAG: hypothetical protein ATN35_10005 [Epulopiscium sp. Nele67-Bin004]